jgi:sugar lactone lactonase YvrE
VVNARIVAAALIVTFAAARAGVVTIDPKAIYPEGPLWQNGKLRYVEYGGPGIKSWDGHAVSIFWSGDHCGPSGLIGHGEGHLLVACYDANTLVEVDAEGHTFRTIKMDSAGKPFIGPNDFAADAKGGLYFSASGVYDVSAPITGAVLYMTAAGWITEVANTIHYSNGLAVAQDGRTLLVSEDLAGRILAFPIHADGTLGPRTVWAASVTSRRPRPTRTLTTARTGSNWGRTATTTSPRTAPVESW